MKQITSGYVSSRVLKLNVGFVLAHGPGYSHETGFDVPAVKVAEDVDLTYLRGRLRLSRAKEGVLVQGTLELGVEDECFRCLEPVQREIEVDVEELYAFPASGDSDFSIDEAAVLDLGPLLRDEAIIADTRGTLCRPDCQGLCPNCGANLNDGPHQCVDLIDPRLAKLRELLEDDQAR
ncbi:MAG TPA: DUF177 domain-containing protein [Candidatus Limnocylindrales bacterium]|nr:DUF177 domain-containing protein [Candidatus Limnocylindrales bacterium]